MTGPDATRPCHGSGVGQGPAIGPAVPARPAPPPAHVRSGDASGRS